MSEIREMDRAIAFTDDLLIGVEARTVAETKIRENGNDQNYKIVQGKLFIISMSKISCIVNKKTKIKESN
jgi:hypothetical protein